MGLKVSKEPLEKPTGYPPPPTGPARPVSDPFEIQCVSPSRFFSLVQQQCTWPDYYALYDMRTSKAYGGRHIMGANPAPGPDEDLSWAYDMLILMYGHSPADKSTAEFIQRLKTCETPPQAIYVLGVNFSAYCKRFGKYTLHHRPQAQSLPCAVEVVPPTAEYPGTLAIHRLHFLKAKLALAYQYIGTIINISSRRLFVKTPNIALENTAFSDDPTPTDFVVTVYMKYAAKKPKKKGQGNILIIDESGCDYASLLAAWHLIQHRKIPCDDAIESVGARIGFLDTWYTDILTNWAQSQ